MSATTAQVARLRRMVAEPTTDTYSDVDIAAYIEAYPLLDAEGNDPDETDWTATYDLHAAAADVWEEKAAAFAAGFDFTADGGSFTRSQQYEQCLKQARYHRARRRMKTGRLIQSPREYDPRDYVINLPEED